MHHIVYQTTNLINGKVYVGVHSTTTLDDGYLGSGYALRSAIRKYGQSAFKRETISSHITREEAFEHEKQIVNEDWVSSTDNYNVSVGGSGKRGPNSRSKTVSVYDSNLNFIRSFETKIEAAAFLNTNPVYITNACKNAAQGKSCRVGQHYVCHNEDKPQKKDLSYLTNQLKKMHQGNRGKKRPEHGRHMRKLMLGKSDKTVYNWIHASGVLFVGSRRELVDQFPEHKINNAELGVMLRGRYKTHKGWSIANTSTTA